MAEFEPKQFGKYYLIEKLAVGGMAEIYKAKTFGVDGFEKELCIKRILSHCSADRDFITMLIDEAKLSVMLSHANIVQVYDLGKVGDDYFISMEYIHGVNLRDVMYRCRETKTPISADIAVYIISEICKGLDYAHRKTDQHNQPLGIVHRDISPQNILLSYEGEVKIVDFGIAKAAMNISHTMAGILKGKIAYMSPEQAMGKSIDGRTDIFSTGILLYEMVTGQKLYTGESQFEVLKKIRTTKVTADTLPDSIPAPLRPILAKALAYNVEERHQNAGDLQIDLTKYLYSTYVDFSPRKLAAFIHNLFTPEFKGEQIERAREEALDQQTSSMNVQEGAKQLEIVHRELSYPPQTEETARARGPSEAFVETVMTPAARRAAAKATEPITERGKAEKEKKGGWLPKAIAALLALAAAAFLLQRFVLTPSPPLPPELSTGSVSLTSDPAGARVFLDGKDMARVTPAILEELSVGKSYLIRVEKEGLTPAEKSVKVSSAEPIDVALALGAPTGTINIITDPAGAAIMVDGKLTGLTTPAAIEHLSLSIEHKITLSKPDYVDYEQALTLSSSAPQKISARLQPVTPKAGTLQIASEPQGASISLNGTGTGKITPSTIANLDPKKYTVTIAMAGYKNWTGTYEVGADQTIPVSAILEKTAEPQTTGPGPEPTPPIAPTTPTEKGTLRISSTPGGARIYLNGKPSGLATPATLANLKVGESYRIGLELEGYKSYGRKFVLRKESDALVAKLEQKPAEPTKPEPPKPEPPKPEPPKPEPPKPEPPKPEPPKPETVATGGTGSVKVASDPSGADVFINGNFQGKTPLTASAPSGSVSVLVSKDGSRASRTVTVKPGQTVSVGEISLSSTVGEVSVTTDPPKAQVTFNGQTIPAPTPVTIRKVPKGRQHSITVSLSGYRSASRSFTMDSDSKAFHIVLQPE